jgi:hypothetical protein
MALLPLRAGFVTKPMEGLYLDADGLGSLRIAWRRLR